MELDFQETAQRVLELVCVGEEQSNVKSKMEKKDGEALPVVLDVNPMSDGAGGVALWVGRLGDGGGMRIETDPGESVDACNDNATRT